MSRNDEAGQREEDLAATMESLQDDAERLVDIEREKQGLDAADPEVDALSIEAERLAVQIEDKSRIERDLADSLAPGGESSNRPN